MITKCNQLWNFDLTTDNTDCVVLVDAENFSGPFVLSSLVSEVRQYGKSIQWFSYGVREHQKPKFRAAGFTLISVPDATLRHKNFVDQQIAVDAVEAAILHPSIKNFVIVSGDADFVPLVLKLRELGRMVIHVASGAVSKQLAQTADISISLPLKSDWAAIAQTCWPKRIAQELCLLAQRRRRSMGVSLAELGNAMATKFGFNPSAEFGLKWHELCQMLAGPNRWKVHSHNGVVYVEF